MTAPEAATAFVQRVLPASPREVYREWLDPDALSEWMCPRPARPTNVLVDAVVGGRLRIDIHDNNTDFFVTGTYLELDPPHRLRFTWSCSTWDDPTLQSVVTVTFEPHGDTNTLMTITHELLPPDTVENHDRGWTVIVDQLESHLLERQHQQNT